MKTKHFILLYVCFLMCTSCDLNKGISNDVESVIDELEEISIVEENDVSFEMTRSLKAANPDGTSGSVRKVAPYDNVVIINWKMGNRCHFKSLDIKVIAPMNNRWTLHQDSLFNPYTYTVSYTGLYEFYVKYYQEGTPSYPMRTERDLCLGRIDVNTISTMDPVVPSQCKHDYSKISFSYYEISSDGRTVYFGGINCTDSYKLILSSPNIWGFEVVKNIYPLTGLQNVSFSLDRPDLYNLKVVSGKCTLDYNKCEDYRVIQFSSSVPHTGQVPLQSFN